jgi:hypothetical protein
MDMTSPRQVRGHAALDIRVEPVAQADVREGAAHHDLVVAAPRAVRVEVLRLDAMLAAGTRPAGLSALMAPAGEMWSVVMLSPSSASTRAPRTSRTGARLRRHVVEVRRVLHVRRVGLPLEQLGLRRGQARHCSSPSKTFAYCRWNISGRTDWRMTVLDLRLRRPDVAQEDAGPSRPVPMGSLYGSKSIRPAMAYATTSGGEAR